MASDTQISRELALQIYDAARSIENNSFGPDPNIQRQAYDTLLGNFAQQLRQAGVEVSENDDAFLKAQAEKIAGDQSPVVSVTSQDKVAYVQSYLQQADVQSQAASNTATQDSDAPPTADDERQAGADQGPLSSVVDTSHRPGLYRSEGDGPSGQKRTGENTDTAPTDDGESAQAETGHARAEADQGDQPAGDQQAPPGGAGVAGHPDTGSETGGFGSGKTSGGSGSQDGEAAAEASDVPPTPAMRPDGGDMAQYEETGKQAGLNSEGIYTVQAHLYALGYADALAYQDAGGETRYIDGIAGSATRDALEAYVRDYTDMQWSQFADRSAAEIAAQLQEQLAKDVADADNRTTVTQNLEQLVLEEINVRAGQQTMNTILEQDETVQLAAQNDIGNDGVLLVDNIKGEETIAGLRAIKDAAPDTKAEDTQEAGPRPKAESPSEPGNGGGKNAPSMKPSFNDKSLLVSDQDAIDEARKALEDQLGGYSQLDADSSYLTMVDAPGWFSGKVAVTVNSNGTVQQVTSNKQLPETTYLDDDIQQAIKQKIANEANKHAHESNPSERDVELSVDRVLGDNGVVEIGGVSFIVDVSENPDAYLDREVEIKGIANFQHAPNEDLQADARLHTPDGQTLFINDMDEFETALGNIKGEFEVAAQDLKSWIERSDLDLDGEQRDISIEFGEAQKGTEAVLDLKNGVEIHLPEPLVRAIQEEAGREKYGDEMVFRREPGPQDKKQPEQQQDTSTEKMHKPELSPDGGMMA